MSDLSIWTIYKNPSDFPGKYVAKERLIGAGQTENHFVADTLDEVREMLPPHLILIARSPQDDPVIVESWL